VVGEQLNKKLILIVIVLFFVGTYFHISEANQCSPRDFRIEDETFSRQSMQVGEPVEIQGLIVSLSQDQLQLEPWAVITFSDHSSITNAIAKIFSEYPKICSGGKYDGNLNWYFTISYDPSEEFTLEPGDEVPYSITLIPQKSGTYHIQSAMLFDDIYRGGPGQTVTVEGRDGVTEGELFGFYLPFVASIALITFATIIGIIGIRRKLQTNHRSKGKLS